MGTSDRGDPYFDFCLDLIWPIWALVLAYSMLPTVFALVMALAAGVLLHANIQELYAARSEVNSLDVDSL